MKILKITFGFLLSLNSIFALIMFGHCISIYAFFHGPPPNKDYQFGHITLTIGLIFALTSCSLAFFLVQFDFKSLIIGIGANAGFAVALITSAIVIYCFRDPRPTSEKFKDYTVAYYKEYGKAPPFIDKLQRSMKGYCCGASSYLDYVTDPNTEFFNVPHTCCFTHLRKTAPNCSKHRWKYLYMFLSSIVQDALKNLEEDYEDMEDLPNVQRRLARKKAPQFIDTHIRDMFKDRVAAIKQNITRNKLKQMSQDEETEENLGPSIANRIYDEAERELKGMKKEILTLLHVSFVPMGCWALMDELQHSKWKGFQPFREVRDRVQGIFQGVLAMNIVHLILLLVSTGVFNYYYYFVGSASSAVLEVDERRNEGTDVDEEGDFGTESEDALLVRSSLTKTNFDPETQESDFEGFENENESQTS